MGITVVVAAAVTAVTAVAVAVEDSVAELLAAVLAGRTSRKGPCHDNDQEREDNETSHGKMTAWEGELNAATR